MSTIAVPLSTEPFSATLDSGQRCQSTSADGRRCTMRRWEGHPTLCVPHARAEAEARASNQQIPSRLSRLNDSDDEPAGAFDFTPPSGEFHTATDVNRALGKIFCLLAQNRIPRRKAVALGYLGQLLLQTLPAVREEINDCLGYKAWTETLESAFYEDEPEEEEAAPEKKNETKLDAKPRAEDETESDAEAILCSAGLQPGMPSALADGPTRNTYTETAAVVDDLAPEDKNETKLDAKPLDEDEVGNEVRNVGPGFSPSASSLGTPISVLAGTTDLTAVASTCSPPETNGTAAEPEAVNAIAERAPETRFRGFVDGWQPPLVYTGPYKSYWEEPAVKEEFFRKYGRPIEEANIPPSRLKRALTPDNATTPAESALRK